MENIEQSIIDDSVITCGEIIEHQRRTVTTNFNENNAICKTKNSIFHLPFINYLLLSEKI